MANEYERHATESVLGRLRWSLGTWAERFYSVTFGMLDVVIDGAKQATKVRFVTDCPDDAVPYHGRERMIEPLEGESIDAWRLRIKDWGHWDVGPTRLLQERLREYVGVDGLYVFDIAFNDWLAGSQADEDGNYDNWSRNAIVIEQPHPWDRPVVGPGLVVGPDLIVGIDMTGAELRRIRRLYRRYRPGHMVGIDLYVPFDSTSADDIRNDRTTTTDFVRMPLGPMGMVGYQHHGMMVGASMVVGQEFI